MSARTLATSALPYANGPSHLGHIAGAYLPADIFVRYLRMRGEDAIFICGSDEHGKPITTRALKEKTTPRAIVDRYHRMIRDEFAGLGIDFDNFSGTARPRHHELSQGYFNDLLAGGYLVPSDEEIFWCPKDNIALADREVEGICPRCGDHIARGDECKRTGAWLAATDLGEPRCTICGATPERRQTRSWFLDLPRLAPRLEAWLDTKTWWKENVLTFVKAWLRDGLKARSMTRDMTWGVPVPIPGVRDKVLYVWLDAPFGYISSTIEWAERIGDPERWRRYWHDSQTRLVHFIGKDNIAFHAVTWPATLMGINEAHSGSAQIVLPHDIPANEYLTLAGQPFSTSQNWAVWTGEALTAVGDPDVLRWTIAANAPESKDADFTWRELADRNNTDLADTIGNLASRTLRFIEQHAGGVIPHLEAPAERDRRTLAELAQLPAAIAEAYTTYRVRRAAATILDVARLGNRYFDEAAPWVTRKTDARVTGNTLHVCCRILEVLSLVAWPIIPHACVRLRAQLGLAPISVASREAPRWEETLGRESELGGRRLGEIGILFRKLDDAFVAEQDLRLARGRTEEVDQKPVVKATTVETPVSQTPTPPATHDQSQPAVPASTTISYEDFAKLELRIGLVTKAERIPKADKLLKLQVDIGGQTRQILAGIAAWYSPEQVVGKRVPVLVNLAPRKLRGEESQGMMLAADLDGRAILLHPAEDVPPGSTVR